MEITKNRITEEDAIKLLFAQDNDVQSKKIFDIYGNYQFPTDINMVAPNSVCGTPILVLSMNQVKIKK